MTSKCSKARTCKIMLLKIDLKRKEGTRAKSTGYTVTVSGAIVPLLTEKVAKMVERESCIISLK